MGSSKIIIYVGQHCDWDKQKLCWEKNSDGHTNWQARPYNIFFVIHKLLSIYYHAQNPSICLKVVDVLFFVHELVAVCRENDLHKFFSNSAATFF